MLIIKRTVIQIFDGQNFNIMYFEPNNPENSDKNSQPCLGYADLAL